MAPLRRKLNAETAAIIAAIENATAAAKIVADAVSTELHVHTGHDDERFEALTKLVESISLDVKSLLASRSFLRGAWKTIVAVGVVTSTLVTAIHSWWGTLIAFLKGHP
jgi:putative N-acetylmannosamine-6-phosphate epimerase